MNKLPLKKRLNSFEWIPEKSDNISTTIKISETNKYLNSNQEYEFRIPKGIQDLKSSFINAIASIKKEDYYNTIILNIYKKLKLTQLDLQLESKLISQEEYDEEFENNQDFYFISQNKNYSLNEFRSLREIMDKLPLNDLSVDEIEELTSAKFGSFNKFIVAE
ncbi:hypothetical protein [Leptospira harrisiae]|uniref:hypothetical protein n=1 Tax=Leptospira harrisiae TaxID=2023189 RepID=UPI000C2A4140|nr:hypothetical protein [Leptospira harrisiae]PKA06385.1 hypothetical protein CH366_19400 [Leptospira harrisiae]